MYYDHIDKYRLLLFNTVALIIWGWREHCGEQMSLCVYLQRYICCVTNPHCTDNHINMNLQKTALHMP